MTRTRRWLGEALPLLVIWIPVLDQHHPCCWLHALHRVGLLHGFDADARQRLGRTAQLCRRCWRHGTGRSLLATWSSMACFLMLTTALGLLLALLIDQKLRGENVVRTIFLYPLAVSFVVTGVVWGWLLNPGIGIQKLVIGLGWTSFRFDWLVDRNRALYCIVFAGAWQASGFAMALFLAGLRSVDADLMKAAQIDGAGPLRTYRRVILPSIWPIFIAVFVILLQFAIKTFDLAMALTAGGPGIATVLPSIVVYDFMFQRGLLGVGLPLPYCC